MRLFAVIKSTGYEGVYESFGMLTAEKFPNMSDIKGKRKQSWRSC